MERVAVAVAGRYEDPFGYVDARMDAFEAWLASDPADTPDAHVEARIRELLEEVA